MSPTGAVGAVAARAVRLDRRPALDGLRALAVAAVLLHHAGIPGVRAGFVGVDVFFTLSGFLITSLLLVEHGRTGRIALAAFWLRRARRLLPALFAVVLAVALTSPLWLDPASRSALVGDGLAALFYVANWRALATGSDYFATFGPPSALAHTWSLSVEEQFYLVWPLVVLAGGLVAARLPRLRRWTPALLVAAAVASTALTVVLTRGGGTMRAYYGTDARSQQLLVGAALGAWAVQRGWWDARSGPVGRGTSAAVDVLGALGLAGLAAIVIGVRDPSGWVGPAGFAVVAVLTGAVLVAVAGPVGGLVRAALSWQPLVAVGAVSYGVYLWHWPVYLLLDPVRTGLEGDGLPAALLAGLRLTVTGLVAVASYRWLEQPVRRTDWSRRDPTVTALAFPGAVTACVSALVLASALGAVSPATDRPALPVAGHAGAGPAVGAAPTDRAAPRPRTVFVLGDSTAWNLHAQFPPARPGLRVAGSSQLGCDLLDGEQVAGGVRLGRPKICSDWSATWHGQLAQTRPDVAVLMLGNGMIFDRVVDGEQVPFGSRAFERLLTGWLDAALTDLAAASGRVFVTDLPCLRKRDTGLDRTGLVVNDVGRQRRLNTLVRAHLATRPGVTVLRLRAAVCPGDRYAEDLHGVRLRTDGVHWTQGGAALVWTWLLAETA